MRQELHFFGKQDLDLVFMARRLREALQIEFLLTGAEIDYFVEPGFYSGGFLFRRELTGAFFYVAPADVHRARSTLSKNGYKPFEQLTSAAKAQ